MKKVYCARCGREVAEYDRRKYLDMRVCSECLESEYGEEDDVDWDDLDLDMLTEDEEDA